MSSHKKSAAKVTPDADLVAWCAALSTVAVPDQVPPGWLTANQLAEKLGKPPSTMGKLLLAAIRAGKCDTQKFRVMSGRGAYPVPHYKLINQ